MVIEAQDRPTLENLPEDIIENRPEDADGEVSAASEIESSLAMDPAEVYKCELELIAAREELDSDDSWKVLEPLAKKAKQKPDYRRKFDRVGFQKVTTKERIRHKGLEARARLKGIKPIDEFHDTVELLESIRSNFEQEYFYFDAKLSPEQVNSKIKQLEAQGWQCDDWEKLKEREDGAKSIRMRRMTTSKVEGKHINAMKVLTKEKSTQILTALFKLGYPVSIQSLEDSKKTSDLGRFLAARNAEQAIEIYGHITEWDFNSPDFLERLTVLAEAEDPKEILPEGDLDKINLLCKSTFKKITPKEIPQYQDIINNPKWLAISTMVAQVGKKSDYIITGLDLHFLLQEWEDKGVIQKLLEMKDAGLGIYSWVESLCRANSSIADQKPEEAIRQIINIEDNPKIKSFLNSPEDQELLKVLHSIGIATDLDMLEKIKTSSLPKENVILITKQLKQIMAHNQPSDVSQVLTSVLNSSEQLVKGFSDINFLTFAFHLTNKTGLPLNHYQYVFQRGSPLLEAYNKPGLAEQLLADSTIEYIKLLGLKELSAYDLENYVGLAQIPRIREITERLSQFGYEAKGSDKLMSVETMRKIADDPNLSNLLFAETTLSLVQRLQENFNWKLENYGVIDLLNLAADQETVTSMFEPENLSYLKKMRPDSLWNLREIKNFLEIDVELRGLLIELSDKLGHHPKTSFGESKVEGMDAYQKLMDDSEFRETLLSDRVSRLALQLKEKNNVNLETNSFEMLAKAPDDLSDFIIGLREKYRVYWINSGQALNSVVSLALNREHFAPALELLNQHGYEFKTDDFDEFCRLSEVLPQLGPILEMIEQLTPLKGGIVLKEEGAPIIPINPSNKHYTFKISDVNSILKLSSHLDDLPGAVGVLAEEIGYSFDLKDSEELAKFCEQGTDKAELASLKEIYAKFVGRKLNLGLPEELTIDQLDLAAFLNQNENLVFQLESIGYSFAPSDINLLNNFLRDENHDKMFEVAKQLSESLNLPFSLAKLEDYRALAKIPDLEQRIQETKDSGINLQQFTQIEQFRLYVFLKADPKQYEHANQLLADPYFTNIRDARNRISVFQKAITERTIGNEEAVSRIFQICEKPKDLDRLALNVTIVSELMTADSGNDWLEEFSKITAPNEAESYLNSVMVDLALPQLYPDKDKEAIGQISADFKEKAVSDPHRSEILAMCCRSLGIYKKYNNQQPRLELLTRGIKDILELNMNTSNPEEYKVARAEASGLQFQRLLSDFDEDTGSRLMESWLDFSEQRRLRLNGTVVTKEEDTLARLSRIKQMVTSDFAVHFKDLLLSKMAELSNLEVASKLKGFNPDEIEILKELITGEDPAEEINIVKSYQRVIREIADTRARLKDPEVKGEAKSKDGRNLKTYEAVGSALKSLFRLGTANEERFKARKDYINEIDKEIDNLSKSLRTLLILDPERPSSNPNVVSLENEVLADISKIREVMSEESINSQMTVETKSTIDFLDLAKAPEMTTSCQRLTEHTGYNHAAISRLSDGINEMIDVSEEKDGQSIKLARCFIELSKVKFRAEEGEEESIRPVVLMDSLYINPQYGMQSYLFAEEMVSHMLDRFQDVPEMCIVIGRLNIDRGSLDAILQEKGWKVSQRWADYFVNQSTVPDSKYYDSLGGLTDVSKPVYKSFNGLLLEQISEPQPVAA